MRVRGLGAKPPKFLSASMTMEGAFAYHSVSSSYIVLLLSLQAQSFCIVNVIMREN